MENPIDFLLVIPAYREEKRLPPFLRELLETLANAPYAVTIQIIDDASLLASQTELETHVRAMMVPAQINLAPLIKVPKRSGKGFAIRHGWGQSGPVKWLAFVDADGAIPAREVRRLFDLVWQNAGEKLPACYCAVRESGPNFPISRHPLRQLGGQLFGWLVHRLMRLPVSDTQCGFKIMSRSAWLTVRDKVQESGFSFDVELLARLQQQRVVIREVPVTWSEIRGGHFRLVRDGLGTTLRILILRFRQLMLF